LRRRLSYVSHPEVAIDPDLPVPDWGLNPLGRGRVKALAASGWPRGPARLVSSPERKAQQTAALLARGAPFETHPRTGEIDRSATGYLPHARHEALADALFAHPAQSAEGWETAQAAQNRILLAFHEVSAVQQDDHLILVGHGGVGTLLWCALTHRPIARTEDQPGGGHVWSISLPDHAILHPWRRFEELIHDAE